MADGVRLVFDSEKAMEDYLERFLDESGWLVWPDLPDGCEWEPGGINTDDIRRQVPIAYGNESGDGPAPVDLFVTRWYRTPEMPPGDHYAQCVMLIELKNDCLSLPHFNQVLRYLEGYRKECDEQNSHPDALCCALIGTGIRSDVVRIARAIPFLTAYEWGVEADIVYMAPWGGTPRAIAPPPPPIDNVVPINAGGGF